MNKKESCYYCLDTGAVDPQGNTPSDSLGPFKMCPVCKIDNATKMMDELIISEVKDLHMNKFVWSLDISVKGPDRAITEPMVLQLSDYINSQVYHVDGMTHQPDYATKATYLDRENRSKEFHRIIFHGSLYYADIIRILKNVGVNLDTPVIKLNRISTKDYL